MAARWKKIFSRKTDSPERRPSRRERRANDNDPTLRASLYDTAEPAALPETGQYPIKGNGSSPALTHRRNSSRGHRKHFSNSEMAPPVPSGPSGPSGQPSGARPMSSNAGGGLRMVQDDTNLSTDLSNLNLSDRDAARTRTQPQARQQAPATSRAPGYGDNDTTRDSTGISAADMRNPQYSYMSSVYGGNTVDPRVDGDRANRSPARGAAAPSADRANRSPAGYVAAPSGDTANRSPTGYAAASSSEYIAKRERALSRGKEQGPVDNVDNYRGRHSPQSSAFNDASAGRQSQSDDTPSRRRSIPRKQVGSGAYSPPSLPSQTFPSSTTSSPSHARQSSVRDKPLPSTPPGTTGRAQNSGYADNRPAQPKLGEQRMLVEGAREKPSLEGVVDLSNTKDTMVIEKIAPAVVHETVNREVHHVREEVITRDIHTHDVYHRIQPIIDVEVLPARHFLPVEGGGLVEISADDVPGRRNNWVLAETASKIPSDEPAPPKTNRFSAREFPGNEGDSTRYVTPEGVKRTEDTWVHPPELEEGGRLTGQTWPMHFPASNKTATPDTGPDTRSADVPRQRRSPGKTSGRLHREPRERDLDQSSRSAAA